MVYFESLFLDLVSSFHLRFMWLICFAIICIGYILFVAEAVLPVHFLRMMPNPSFLITVFQNLAYEAVRERLFTKLVYCVVKDRKGEHNNSSSIKSTKI